MKTPGRFVAPPSSLTLKIPHWNSATGKLGSMKPPFVGNLATFSTWHIRSTLRGLQPSPQRFFGQRKLKNWSLKETKKTGLGCWGCWVVPLKRVELSLGHLICLRMIVTISLGNHKCLFAWFMVQCLGKSCSYHGWQSEATCFLSSVFLGGSS